MYPLIHDVTLRDKKMRALINYFIFSVVLSVACVILFPKQENENGTIILLILGIEIISKQMMDFSSDFVNYIIGEYSFNSWIEATKFKALWCLIHFAISLVEAILLFAMVLPVSISQIELSEWQKVLIFGIVFPLFRFLNFV